jgi:hypothetical protein
MRRSLKYLIAAMVATAGLVGVTVGPAVAAAGTAAASKPVYNAQTGNWDYHCSFAHWRSDAPVSWTCDLYELDRTPESHSEWVLVNRHSGGWTPGSTSLTTATFHRAKTVGEDQYCVEAFGLNVDGGFTSKRACN